MTLYIEAGIKCYHFADNILELIYLYEKFCILIKISLNLFKMVQPTINHESGSDNGLLLNRWQAIIRTSDGLVY